MIVTQANVMHLSVYIVIKSDRERNCTFVVAMFGEERESACVYWFRVMIEICTFISLVGMAWFRQW